MACGLHETALPTRFDIGEGVHLPIREQDDRRLVRDAPMATRDADHALGDADFYGVVLGLVIREYR